MTSVNLCFFSLIIIQKSYFIFGDDPYIQENLEAGFGKTWHTAQSKKTLKTHEQAVFVPTLLNILKSSKELRNAIT